VSVDGERDILGLWAGDGGEGAKYWLQVLTEIKNRGVADACIVVCDGLAGLPDAISAVWPQALTQRCIVHLLRNSFRYASRRDWPLSPATPAGLHRTDRGGRAGRAGGVRRAWEARYPAIIKLRSTPGPSSSPSWPSTSRSAP
jgi:transposase-like protein